MHGRRSPASGRGGRLYPLYHPAAALYTPEMLDMLREDFRRLPELLALDPPEQPEPEPEPEPVVPEPEIVAEVEREPEAAHSGSSEPPARRR